MCSEIGEHCRRRGNGHAQLCADVHGGRRWRQRYQHPHLLLRQPGSVQRCREADQPATSDRCRSVLRRRHRRSSPLEQPRAATWRMPANNVP